MIHVKPQKINMKLKSTASLLYLLFFSWANAQLHPSAAFQISSTTQGFLLPIMTQSQMNNISDPADGLMINCSDCPGGRGVRIFNSPSSSWVGNSENLYGRDGQLTENRTVSLTTNKLSFVSNSGSSTLSIDGQNKRVGIGTVTPTAALEVSSADNGILIPRISLTASATYGLSGTATESILVYNTNTATNTGLKGKGFYYWNSNTTTGTWVQIGSGGENVYTVDDSLTDKRTVGMGENQLIFDGDNGSLKLNSTAGENKEVVKNSGIGSPYETFDSSRLSYISAQGLSGFENNINHIFDNHTNPLQDPHVQRVGRTISYWGLKYNFKDSFTIQGITVVGRNGNLNELQGAHLELYKNNTRVWTSGQLPTFWGDRYTTPTAPNVLADEIRVVCLTNLCGTGAGEFFAFNTLQVNGNYDGKFMEIKGSLKLTSLPQQSSLTQNDQVLITNSEGEIKTVSSSLLEENLYRKDGQLTENRTVSLTTNKLSFISNSGGSTLSIDGQNERVGIGTNNPTATLDVNGNSIFGGTINTKNNWISGDGDQQGLYVKLDGGVVMQNADASVNQLTVYGSSLLNGNINTNNNWISGDGGNEGIYIADNGNVGIGTNSPSARLQVNGNASFNRIDIWTNSPGNSLEIRNHTSWNPFAINTLSGTGGAGGVTIHPNDWKKRVELATNTAGDFRVYAGEKDRFLLTSDGRLGIGTTNPSTRLHVSGQTGGDFTYNRFTYMWEGGSGYEATKTETFADIVAVFDGRTISEAIISTIGYTFSDARIKNVKGISNPKDDLAILNKIKITDYTKKDVMTYGRKAFKKVIAQELEKIYPQVVNKETHGTYIPDIYKFADVKAASEENVFDFTFKEAVTPEKDVKKIRVHLKDGTKKEAQYVSQPNKKKLRLKLEGYEPDDMMFVYGSEVYDFRTVDYDGLTTLNISATQALYKKIKAQEKRIKKLEDELTKTNKTILLRLEALEKK